MQINRKTIKLDATSQAPGRLASQVAAILIGKNKVEYELDKDMGDGVIVENVDKIKFTGKKLDQKNYYHHSGYPGGLKTTSAKKLMAEHPEDVIRKAVFNMLPKNKLRNDRMKRLDIRK
jgi:large subunit ribosomal protein L13